MIVSRIRSGVGASPCTSQKRGLTDWFGDRRFWCAALRVVLLFFSRSAVKSEYCLRLFLLFLLLAARGACLLFLMIMAYRWTCSWMAR